MNIVFEKKLDHGIEIVERKGLGHPDTLADGLAEELSCVYAKYTQDRYGAVLHHNFDKVGIMGGETKVGLGEYQIKKPIRVLLNGRASNVFGDDEIPLRTLLVETTKNYFAERLFGIDPDKDLKILYEVSTGSSPGSIGDASNLRNRWFQPSSLNDLSELKQLNCNDTSLGTGFYKRTILEDCVWRIENNLNSSSFRNKHSWIGTDIKIMGIRNGKSLKFTMAIPQLASSVNSISEYMHNKEFLYAYILDQIQAYAPGYEVEISINTRDKTDNSIDLYLTATGSSIEMGDEGFVGRGNRIGGLITPFRPYTMEGICGKNPIYHTGKMYSIAAWEISKELYSLFGKDINVLLVGQSGHPLSEPYEVVLTGNNEIITSEAETCVKSILNNFSKISENILNRKYQLC